MEILVHCKFDEMRSVDELEPYHKNRNNHPQDQIDRLAELFKYHGIRHPVIVDAADRKTIIAGHGRRLAAIRAGIDQVPVVYQEFESEEQRYAFVQSDNAVAAWAELDIKGINADLGDLGPDFDIDMLGIKDFTLDVSDKFGGKNDDAVPESAPAICKLGDVWQLGRHRLMCGDSTSESDVMKLIEEDNIDLIYADPPYGIDEETDRANNFVSKTRMAKANTFKKIIGDISIDTALKTFNLADQLCETICYWGGNYFAHNLPPSASWIVWDKRVEDNQRDMNSDAELAYVKHPTKESVRIFRHLWKGMIKASEHGQARVHPTQKPVALAEWCFRELNKDGHVVLDLFVGSGSTLIACEKSGRKCLAMELSPEYCDTVIKRWSEYTGLKAELVSS